MTTLRKDLQNLVGDDFDLPNANASLWLDKFIFDSRKDEKSSWSQDETAKAEIVRKVTQKIIEPPIYKTYFENGLIETEGAYINGRKNGVWKYSDANGKIIKRESWKNGEVVVPKAPVQKGKK